MNNDEQNLPTVEDENHASMRLVRDLAESVSTAKGDPESYELVGQILSNHKYELRAFQVASARRSAARIAKLQSYVDRVETELMQDIRLVGASTPELIKLMQVLQNSLDSEAKMIATVAERATDAPPPINLVKDERTYVLNMAESGTPRERESVRSLFASLQKLAAERGNGAV